MKPWWVYHQNQKSQSKSRTSTVSIFPALRNSCVKRKARHLHGFFLPTEKPLQFPTPTMVCIDHFLDECEQDIQQYEIEYIDEMGYVYVSCRLCPEYNLGCNLCVDLSWDLSQQIFAVEDLQRAPEQPPTTVEEEEESWD